MVYGLPEHGEANWDTKLVASIEAVKGTADAALPAADLDDILEGYDVILVAGQSNAVGADNTRDTSIDTTDSRIFEYALSGTDANTIQPASDPLHHIFATAQQVGPGMSFARWWAARNPNRKVLLVPHALGSSGFEASTSSPNARWKVGRVQAGETNLYDSLVAKSNAALVAGGEGSRPVAAIFCQGEADGSTSGPTYQTDLLAFIDGVRTNVTGAVKLPFLLLSMVPSTLANSNRSTINAVHVDTPYLREFCGYAVGLAGHDNLIHYDATAQRYNGSVALAGAYLRAQTNRIGTAPNAPTNVLVVQAALDSSTATVTWDAAVGRVTDYTVQYRLAEGDTWSTLARSRSLATTASITGLTLGNYVEVRVLTVNEAGTSAPSSTSRCAMLPAPNIHVGQGGGGDVDVTTSEVSGAIGYRFDYKLSTDTTWTPGTTGTTTSDSISGLSTDPHDFRVVVFTPIGTVIGTATSFTPSAVAIDPSALTGSTIAQAWGLRQVVNTWSGNVIRVRDEADVETNIGLDGIDIDNAALLTAAGGGNLWVVTVFDQSGNGRDITQSAHGSQPQIVEDGVVLTNNGRPAMRFDGTDDYLVRTTAEFYSSGAGTLCGVASGTITSTLQECVFGEGGSGSNVARYFVNKCATNGGLGFNVISDASSSDVMTQDLGDAADTTATFGPTATQWSVVDSGTTITRYRGGSSLLANGTQLSPVYTRSGRTLTLNRQAVGALVRIAATTFAKMRLSELVVFNTAVSNADRQVVENNQKAYYGTPTGL